MGELEDSGWELIDGPEKLVSGPVVVGGEGPDDFVVGELGEGVDITISALPASPEVDVGVLLGRLMNQGVWKRLWVDPVFWFLPRFEAKVDVLRWDTGKVDGFYRGEVDFGLRPGSMVDETAQGWVARLLRWVWDRSGLFRGVLLGVRKLLLRLG